jgi:hypothetical protein
LAVRAAPPSGFATDRNWPIASNVHGITATGEYQVRFPRQLRHPILPDLFDTPGDEITDLDSNVHPWWELEFAAALRQGGFDVAD